MKRPRFVLSIALLAMLAGPLAPRAIARTSPTISISAPVVETAPLPPTTPLQEEVFIFAQVRYSGDSDVLRLNPTYFRLADSSGVMQPPIPYDGANPLLPQELVGQAQTQGWLLFAVPITDATNLALIYEQSHSGSIPAQLPRTPPFTPRTSSLRGYATAAQQALDAYLGDEALAAGYIVLNINPRQTSALVPPSGEDRAYLEHAHTMLRADHAAFDRITPRGKAAAGLKAQADLTFAAIEKDLAGAASLHSKVQWIAWRAAFSRDDRTLAHLYQAWPGAQPVPIP